VLVAKLKSVPGFVFAGGTQRGTKPVMRQLMKVRPTSGSQVLKLIKRPPTDIHVTCDDHRALKGLSDLQGPVDNFAIQEIFVTTNNRVRKQINSENMDRNLMDLYNGVQESLGTPCLLWNKIRPWGNNSENTCQTNTFAKPAEGTKGTCNLKFISNRVGTRKVKAKTPELRRRAGRALLVWEVISLNATTWRSHSRTKSPLPKSWVGLVVANLSLTYGGTDAELSANCSRYP
jgi:hypothetical protein